jgi:hypothetical protein
MSLIDSFNRWKKILKDLKRSEDKIDKLYSNKSAFHIQHHSELFHSSKIGYRNRFKNTEYSVYSQNGEDGIISAILKETGIYHHRFIEFGFGNGRQCNSANLAIHYGWDGLFIDGNLKQTQSANEYFQQQLKGNSNDVKVVNAFITKENINQLFSENNMVGKLDVMSIDIDGNDYWIWEVIHVADPNIVVMEYNPVLGAEKSIVVEYDSAFERFAKHSSGYYYGASLLAYTKLANKKGYGLVGCDSKGVNAFFVKKELIKGWLKEVSPAEAYYEDHKCKKAGNQKIAFEKIKSMPFIEI